MEAAEDKTSKNVSEKNGDEEKKRMQKVRTKEKNGPQTMPARRRRQQRKRKRFIWIHGLQEETFKTCAATTLTRRYLYSQAERNLCSDSFQRCERLVKQFKLQSVIDTGNMHAFASTER